MTSPETCDVVVIGSGAAGLFTAIAAQDQGLRTRVLEKAATLGGGTAISSGLLWVGGNHLNRTPDPGTDVADYLRYVAAGAQDERRMAAFVDHAPAALRYFEGRGVPFQVTARIDHYHGMAPGAVAHGRIVETPPTVMSEAGGFLVAASVSPLARLSNNELGAFGGVNSPAAWAEAKSRSAETRAAGAGLVTWLVRVALEHGMTIHTGTTVDRLTRTAERITGVVLADGSHIEAGRGVVIATGGYESDPGKVANFENLPGWQSMFPETITGDGMRLARERGAEIRVIHNNHAVFLGFRNPDEAPGGTSVCRLSGIQELTARHTVMVNRSGQRFADETFFQAIAPTLGLFDVKARRQPNLPCFLIFDSQYGGAVSFAGRPPGAAIPGWVPRAATPRALAARLGIDPDGLTATLDRFNADTRAGRDTLFHRGEAGWGQMRVSPASSLGTVEAAPFFGIELHPTALGSAGLLADPAGRVMDVRGRIIPGLYAVGNAAAHTEYGSGYQTGFSLASGMVFGLLAARDMAGGQ